MHDGDMTIEQMRDSDMTTEQILDDINGGPRPPRKKRSLYFKAPCPKHQTMGVHGLELISARGLGPSVEPGTPFPGSVSLVGHAGDLAPYDIYECDEYDEGWVLIAFDAEVGEGAELVKRIFPHPELSASLISLEDDAYVKCTWFDRAGIHVGSERRWGHIVNGEVTLLTPGEAVSLGLEKPKVEKVQLVVTDEPAIAEYLVENEVAEPGVRVVESASIEDVRGINVAGDIPVYLAAHARSITSVHMGDVPRKSNKKLTLKQVRKNVLGVYKHNVEGA